MVTVKRVWVRDRDIAILWQSHMDTGGEAPVEVTARPGFQAAVNGHQMTPEATQALLARAKGCPCGVCEACEAALQVAALNYAEAHAEKD